MVDDVPVLGSRLKGGFVPSFSDVSALAAMQQQDEEEKTSTIRLSTVISCTCGENMYFPLSHGNAKKTQRNSTVVFFQVIVTHAVVTRCRRKITSVFFLLYAADVSQQSWHVKQCECKAHYRQRANLQSEQGKSLLNVFLF